MPRMRRVTFYLPVMTIRKMDELVAEGRFATKSEMMRYALMLLFDKLTSGR